MVESLNIFALATDPIYIGTGGYTIGRVDNTIVRDPITNLPKIPGSSLAGTWRYYVTLEALNELKDKQPSFEEIKKEDGKTLGEKLKKYNWKNIKKDDNEDNWKYFIGNQLLKLSCAGQDNAPNEEIDSEENTGHCGHCIVCKGFGFSKKDISWQGILFFSDLNILFFPVFTIRGTKWITTPSLLEKIGREKEEVNENKIKTKNGDESHLNLGWLYLEVEDKYDVNLDEIFKFDNFELKSKDIIIVPESLFSQIVNSNLEVRTSVSIDPLTGTAKEGALFTSEAIPRGTIFYGNVRIFDKKSFESQNDKLNSLPETKQLKAALEDSKHFYESLGIGGMTTRGFGRLKIIFENENEKNVNSNEGGENEQSNK